MKAKLMLAYAMLILSSSACADDEMAKAVDALVKTSTAQGFSCGKVVGMHELAKMVSGQITQETGADRADFEAFSEQLSEMAQKCLSEKPIREALGEKVISGPQ